METTEEQHTERLRRDLMSREVGQHTNGLDETGPPWDRTRARCGGGNAVNDTDYGGSQVFPLIFYESLSTQRFWF